MKIQTFKYTDAKGKESTRVLLVSAEPTKLVAGTDISSLEQEDQALYIQKVSDAKEAYLETLKEINNKFDLNHNFRQFKPENMKDVIEEVM